MAIIFSKVKYVLYDCILYIIKIDSGRLKKCPSKLSAYFSPAMFGLDGFVCLSGTASTVIVWYTTTRRIVVARGTVSLIAKYCTCTPDFPLNSFGSGCTIISNPHSQYKLPSQQDTIPPPHLTDNNCSDYIGTMDNSRFS